MEVFKRGKNEPLERLRTRLISERAKGRCEWEEHEGMGIKRCRELDGEPAIDFKGYVQLHLMPLRGATDGRIANLRCLCQRHAWELYNGLAQGVGYVNKRPQKADKNQVTLL